MEHWMMMKRKGSKDALSQVIASVIGEGITNPYPLHGADRHTGKDLFLSENVHHY